MHRDFRCQHNHNFMSSALFALILLFNIALGAVIFPDYTARVSLRLTIPGSSDKLFSGDFSQSTSAKASILDTGSRRILNRYDAMVSFVTATDLCKAISPVLLNFESFSFVLAAGTVSNGSDVINGIPCTWFFQPVGSTEEGYYLCAGTSESTSENDSPAFFPVQYKLNFLPYFFLEENFTNFTIGSFPPIEFEIPKICNFSGPTDLPYGLFDGFEQGINPIWLPAGNTYVKDHITVQNEIVRSGKFSANITVYPGDCRMNGGFTKFTERDELTSPMFMIGGAEVWYGFSLKLPENFEITDTRLVVAQWKSGDMNSQSPIVALRFVSGNFFVTVRNLSLGLSDKDEVKYFLDDAKLGSWMDFILQIVWADNVCSEGIVRTWLNGSLAMEFRGKTSLTCSVGSTFDFHVGLYRDEWNKPWTIYLDNWSVGKSYKEVDPARFDVK